MIHSHIDVIFFLCLLLRNGNAPDRLIAVASFTVRMLSVGTDDTFRSVATIIHLRDTLLKLIFFLFQRSFNITTGQHSMNEEANNSVLVAHNVCIAGLCVSRLEFVMIIL